MSPVGSTNSETPKQCFGLWNDPSQPRSAAQRNKAVFTKMQSKSVATGAATDRNEMPGRRSVATAASSQLREKLDKDTARQDRVRQAAMRMAERAAKQPMRTTMPKAEIDALLSRQSRRNYVDWRTQLENAAAMEERQAIRARLKAEGKRLEPYIPSSRSRSGTNVSPPLGSTVLPPRSRRASKSKHANQPSGSPPHYLMPTMGSSHGPFNVISTPDEPTSIHRSLLLFCFQLTWPVHCFHRYAASRLMLEAG